MPLPEGWSPEQAVVACPVIEGWESLAWRFHKRKYRATDHGGSLTFSARFNRGLDLFPADEIWPALYLALAPEISIGERQRHARPERLPELNDYPLTTLSVTLAVVLDCTDATTLGISLEDLCHDTDFSAGQHLAAAALAQEIEAMIVPSATRLGNNLVVFPTQLRPTSRIVEVSHIDPRLYVERI
jgi:RES domain-containing protein